MHQQHRTADTSRAAFTEARASGSLTLQSRIVSHFLIHPQPLTRAELSAVVGLPINVICGRVNELLKLGRLLEDPARLCRMGGKRNAHPVRLAPGQPDMFK